MIYYYVDAINGVDEVTAGTLEKPFKTLDYCITQIHTRNIKKLNLEDEEQVLFLLNSDIETLDEAIENEREKYLSDIIARAYEEDITIYLENGEYLLSNRNIFEGVAEKNLFVIGKGNVTNIVFDRSFANNYGTGTQGFNVHFYRLIISCNFTDDTTNFLGATCNLHLKNVLFKDIPYTNYGFWSKFAGEQNKSTIQYCVQNNDVGLLRGTTYYNNDECFGNYGKFQCVYDCQSSFLENDNNKVGILAQLDEDYNITDSSVDTTKIGLYVGEYAWTKQDCLIKMNSKYYSINEEFWNTETKQFNDIGSLDFEKSFDLSLLTKETTYGVDTFIPLDKFGNFSIVFKDDKIKKLDINGFKLANITVITNPIDLRMVESFNNITINGNNVKCLFKINDEEQYYGYNFGENTIQNEDITNISINGINISNVKNIDFNKIKDDREGDLSKITFSFYLEQNSLVENINIDYLEVGEYVQKDSYYTNLKIGYKRLTLQPSFNAQILKINVL